MGFWAGIGAVTRWLVRMLVRLALALVVLLGVALWLASRSLPAYDEDRFASGLGAPVEILRDARAVPHVFGASDADVLFGLGYAHATDRLWQMELRRRMVEGRLSETFGWWARRVDEARVFMGEAPLYADALLRLDIAVRGLDFFGAAERSLAGFEPETSALLEAYSAGVNARLAAIDADALGAGAPELLLLGAGLRPWRPVDSVAAVKLLAASLTAPAIASELARGAALIRHGPERAGDLFPEAGGPASLAPDPRAADAAVGRLAGLFGLDAVAAGGASNAFAAVGARSATRAPLLANDPHLPLEAPGLWYMARLEFASGGVIGATVPGVPAVLLGRNERLAWGATTLYADGADVFLEEVDPQDPSRYRTPEGFTAIETRRERIDIGGGGAVETVLRRTRHGPVLPLDFDAVARVTPPGYLPALSWTVLAEDDRTLEAAIGLMRAGSIAEALRLADRVTAPTQNLFLADAAGVARIGVGRTPLRRPESETRGRAPARGWRAENDWAGLLGSDALPRLLDPPGGVLADANNRLPTPPFPRHVGHDWPEPYRYDRLVRLLAGRQYHTVQGFQAIQNDAVSEAARRILPLMARPLWDGLPSETGRRRAVLEALAAWSGDMEATRAEPLIYVAWARALTRRLLENGLGTDAPAYARVSPLFLERVLSDADGAADRWCDAPTTADVDACADVASAALDDALAELEAAYGPSPERWRWGRAHEAVHAHALFGDWPGFGWLFDIRHEAGGGDDTLRRMQTLGTGATPDRAVHGPGYRAIYDFADLDRSVFAIATGQSGHFLSRHYDDFAEIWRAGDVAPLSLARRDAEAGAVGMTRLRPAFQALEAGASSGSATGLPSGR